MARMRDAAMAGSLLATAVLFGSLLSATAGHAAGEPAFGCKKVHRGKADVDPNPKGRAPVAIGDSTMILPIQNLNAVGYSVNARGCRGFRESINTAAKLRARHHLPHLVLINAYGNGGVNPDLIAEALKVLGKKRVLGLITAYNADTGKPPAPDTDVLFKAARQHKHRVFVLDWVRYSRPHHAVEPAPGAWFLPDLFHPNFTGAEAFAQFLADALPLARNGSFP
jgi:hypothetical protein